MLSCPAFSSIVMASISASISVKEPASSASPGYVARASVRHRRRGRAHDGTRARATPGDEPALPFVQLGFRAQVATLMRGLAGAPERRVLLSLCGGVVLVLLGTVAAQVALNAWNAPFYDAIQSRDVARFLHELLVFLAIAGSLLVLNVVQMWLNLMLQLKLRAGLMHDLLDLWLQPMRAFRLAHAGILGVNPDQRLHEDTRHLTELTTTLAIGLLQAHHAARRLYRGAVAALGRFRLPRRGPHLRDPRLHGLGGAGLRGGRLAGELQGGAYSLIHLNAERYGREAELRSTLVRVSDHVATISLHRGEGSERRLLEGDLGHVLGAMRAIVSATTKLTWVTAGYGWLTQVVPIIVAAPVYFSGQISFGELMMAVGAFNQVQSSLQWFVAAMGWRIGDRGFEMTLASRIPRLIAENLRGWLVGWLAGKRSRDRDRRLVGDHPGGPKILSAVGEATGLDRALIEPSSRILARYGNMSSPTVLFILDQLRREGAARPTVAMGFGPGLAIEAAIFA